MQLLCQFSRVVVLGFPVQNFALMFDLSFTSQILYDKMILGCRLARSYHNLFVIARTEKFITCAPNVDTEKTTQHEV